jgi:uncharacterized membrane protein
MDGGQPIVLSIAQFVVLLLRAVVARPSLCRTVILFVRCKDLQRRERARNKNRHVSVVLRILILDSVYVVTMRFSNTVVS